MYSEQYRVWVLVYSHSLNRSSSTIYFFVFQISIVPGPLGVPGPSVQKLAEKGLEQRLGQRPLQRLEGEFAMDNPPRQKFAKWIVQSVVRYKLSSYITFYFLFPVTDSF